MRRENASWSDPGKGGVDGLSIVRGTPNTESKPFELQICVPGHCNTVIGSGKRKMNGLGAVFVKLSLFSKT